VRDVSAAAALDGDLLGLTPDGRLLVSRAAQARAATAVVGLDWLRELRQLLFPPVAEPSR
jgi:hypothetical protein